MLACRRQDRHLPQGRALRAQGRPQPGRQGGPRLPRPVLAGDHATATAPRPRPTSSDARPAPRPRATRGTARSSPPAAPPRTSTRVATPTSRAADRSSPACATTRSSSTSRASSSSRTQLLGGSTSRHAPGRLHGHRHLRRDERPLDRDQAAERQARRHGNSIGVFATTSVPSNGGWKQIDRIGRPAINTVFNGLILPAHVGLQRPGEGRLQRPAPRATPATTTDNVDDRAQRDRQRAHHEHRDGVHAGRGLGDRVGAPARRARRSRSAAARRSPRAPRSGRWRSTAASWRRRHRRGVRPAHQLRDHDRRRRERERQGVLGPSRTWPPRTERHFPGAPPALGGAPGRFP